MQRGEDDLFINQVANENNTRVETSPDAVIRMQPVERYKDWKEEKVSYMATSRFYKGSQRWLLGLETGTRLLFYAACLAGIVFGILSFHWLVVGLPCYCGSSAIRYKPTSSTKQPVRWVTTVLTTLRCRFLT